MNFKSGVVFLFCAFIAAILHAQIPVDSSWKFINYNDGYDKYRWEAYGLTVDSNKYATVYEPRNADQLRYCYSNDDGVHWTTEVIEDSSASFYDNLPGLRNTLDSSAYYYRVYKRPFLSYNNVYRGMNFRLDKSGTPHVIFKVSYSTWRPWQVHEWLKHAWRENGKWRVEVIAETFSPVMLGGEESMDIGKDGTLHVVFGKCTVGGANPWKSMYAKKVSGKWAITQMDSIETNGVTLRVSNTGVLHCVFGLTDNGSVYEYSSDHGKTWTKENLPQCTWWEVNLALSPAGIPHLVFKDLHKGMMHSMRKGKDNWETTCIYNSDPIHSARPEILFDDCDRIHVAFFGRYTVNQEAAGLIHAVSTDDGKTWTLSWVDKEAFNQASCGVPGMCIDHGRLFFSYYLPDGSARIARKRIACHGDPLHG